MTTGSRGLEGAGDVLKSILGDEPAQPVLGCCLWPRGKANVGKAAVMAPEGQTCAKSRTQ